MLEITCNVRRSPLRRLQEAKKLSEDEARNLRIITLDCEATHSDHQDNSGNDRSKEQDKADANEGDKLDWRM